jgi:excisionase family DNA binding protein
VRYVRSVSWLACYAWHAWRLRRSHLPMTVPHVRSQYRCASHGFAPITPMTPIISPIRSGCRACHERLTAGITHATYATAASAASAATGATSATVLRLTSKQKYRMVGSMKAYMNAAELAKLLHVDRATVSRWIHQGLLRGAMRPAGQQQWRIPLSTYEELVRARSSNA